MERGTCKSARCGAPILWAITRAGRRIPLDADPVGKGEGIIWIADDGVAEFVSGHNRPPEEVTTFYVTHFTTCPDAKHFHQAPKAAPLKQAELL